MPILKAAATKLWHWKVGNTDVSQAQHNEDEMKNHLDPGATKRAVDWRMISNQKLRMDTIANGKDANEEDYTAACQGLLHKWSDIKTTIEALLKFGDTGAKWAKGCDR